MSWSPPQSDIAGGNKEEEEDEDDLTRKKNSQRCGCLPLPNNKKDRKVTEPLPAHTNTKEQLSTPNAQGFTLETESCFILKAETETYFIQKNIKNCIQSWNSVFSYFQKSDLVAPPQMTHYRHEISRPNESDILCLLYNLVGKYLTFKFKL